MSCRNKVNFAGLLHRSNFCPGMKPRNIWSLLEGNDNQQQYSSVMCCYYTLATFMSLVPSLIHLCLTPVTPFPSANTTYVSLQFSAHRSKLELVLMVQNLEVSLATVQLVKSCFKSSDNPSDINDLGPKTFEFCWLSFTLRRGCARTQLGPPVLTCVHRNTFCHRRIKPRVHLLQHLLLVWVCVSVCVSLCSFTSTFEVARFRWRNGICPHAPVSANHPVSRDSLHTLIICCRNDCKTDIHTMQTKNMTWGVMKTLSRRRCLVDSSFQCLSCYSPWVPIGFSKH